MLKCVDFCGFISSCYFVLVSIEPKISETQEKAFHVCHRVSNHLKFLPKYSATDRIFKSLLGVSKCDETPSHLFDI